MSEIPARRGIQSIEIAFRLLQVLQASRRPLPLKEIAAGAGMSPSAANNYLVSLVRTGLAATDGKPGHYRLGSSAVALGMSAIQQIDGFEIARQEVTALRDTTRHSAAVTAWTDDGPVSLFKQEGDWRSALELRTGLLSITATAAGKVFAACLPEAATLPLIGRERGTGATATLSGPAIVEAARREMREAGYVVVRRDDGTGYASAAAPVRDWSGGIRFALSIIGSQNSLSTERGSAEVRELLACAARATAALGGAAQMSADPASG
ncbi:IclR family transcriptional regulator [Roseomonas populi]|uniref:Helix-turn-helix domain-containing protein n=1 Tax=Roseomonas populi TaxID=3121582 RepID=A0ABT1XBR9_9PROT|nr:helix-turn-helix domain-containing protein [Roseomonas pecuniae]MCR0985575.1 helix-turn-helix domain-containing protein [Roseomonas pecuniae]